MRRALLLVLLPGLLLVALLVWLLGSSAPAPVATPGSASAESKTPAPAVPDEPPSSGAARSPRSAPPSPVASSSARSEAPDPDAYRGQVTSPEGPVAQAWVGLIRSGRFPAGFTRTDSKGRFSLKAPEGSDDAEAEGSLQLRASHSGYGEAVVDAHGPGEYTLALPGGGFLEGRVVDEDGEGLQTFAVAASPEGRGRFGNETQSFDTRDGRFRLGPVAPGSHRITAASEGFQPSAPVVATVASGETTTGITLVLERSGEVHGRVTDASTGRPIEGALIVPTEWGASHLAESVGATTGADGRYVLRALPDKRSSIEVRAEGYRTLLGGGVQVARGQKIQRDFSLNPARRGETPGGELVGIGAVLEAAPDGVRLGHLVEGGPASAVLSTGDVLLQVDGRATRGMDMGDVANAIRGELGSSVTLLVRRAGGTEPEKVVLERARVNMPDRNHRGRRAPHPLPNR